MTMRSPTPDTRDAVAVAIDDLVAANRILANEAVIDAFGHISCRHPERPTNFLMSRARAPALVTADDIIEFDAAGTPIDAGGRRPYIERFIHAGIYEARPDIASVVHDHSVEIIPFGLSKVQLRPVSHVGGLIGAQVPVWDIADKFASDSNLMVVNIEMGRDLALRMGSGQAVLMRGHGAAAAGPSIRVATIAAIMLNQQARLLRDTISLGGGVVYLSPGEVAATAQIFDDATPGDAIGRTWEYWCMRAGMTYHPHGA